MFTIRSYPLPLDDRANSRYLPSSQAKMPDGDEPPFETVALIYFPLLPLPIVTLSVSEFIVAKLTVAKSFAVMLPPFMVIFALYNIAALARLGYFNVMEEERQNETDAVRAEYQGLLINATIFRVVLLIR